MTLGFTIFVEGAHRVPGHAVNETNISADFMPYLSYALHIAKFSRPNQFHHLDGIVVWKYLVENK